MSTLTKIRAAYESLTNNERKLADFILANPTHIRSFSSQKLAQEALVSQSSVVKFTQKMGYEGYGAFKLGMVDSVNKLSNESQLHGEISLTDDMAHVIEKLAISKRNTIEETKNLNNAAHLQEVIRHILKAKRIMVAGIGGSALVCKDLCYKLQKIGLSAFSELDGHVQLSNVASFGENDLLFAISESGNSREIIEMVKHAKSTGCAVVSLTQYGSNSVAKLADINLYSLAEQNEQLRLSSITARTSQNYIVDAIFIMLSIMSEEHRELLRTSNSLVSKLKK